MMLIMMMMIDGDVSWFPSGPAGPLEVEVSP